MAKQLGNRRASQEEDGRMIGPWSPAVAAVAGTGLLMLALRRRRGVLGIGLAALAGGLIFQASTRFAAGCCQARASAPLTPPLAECEPFDIVQEASEESFPASDAPGWW